MNIIMKSFKRRAFIFFLLMYFSEVMVLSFPGKGHKEMCFQDVVKMASALAEKSYQKPDRNNIPEFLKKIGYDQWMDISYNPAKSLWPNDVFKVQFFHRGFIFPEAVTVHYVDRKGVHTMPFSPNLFNYKNNKYNNEINGDIGFSGFRIHYPFNRLDIPDELVSFLGASYFRALGRDHFYGLSARGLAVNTGEDVEEEFPFFREFWIIRPGRFARKIKIFALMDSVSLTGGYEFDIRPGEQTVMDVKCTVFIREPIRKLGIAPLTSMFCFGEHSDEMRKGDFRSEVHDSDGFLIQTNSGEWIWHPLLNPRRALTNAFSGGQPRGFGLMQRDINFDHYQDLQARYGRRPSAWVEPKGDWGTGHIELYQFPTANEYADNISAYWVPEESLGPGESLNFAYTLSWCSPIHKRPFLAIADSTRILTKEKHIRFMIDFHSDGKKKSLFKKDLTADIQVLNGYKLSGSQIIENSVTGGLRLVIYVRFDKEGFLDGVVPNELPAVDLIAYIKHKDERITETWSYTYLP